MNVTIETIYWMKYMAIASISQLFYLRGIAMPIIIQRHHPIVQVYPEIAREGQP
jgi:hypothetical protein